MTSEPVPEHRLTTTTRRLEAVGAFLLAQPSRLLAVAAGLDDQRQVYESSIRGPSMRPAIEAGARLRVRLQTGENCKPGDIAYFLTPHGYMVHRVVFCGRKYYANGYLLTCGDNHLAPDPPVPHDQVLGTVFACTGAEGWRDTPAQYQGPLHRRAVRLVARLLALAAFGFGVRSATLVAKLLMLGERLCRATLSQFSGRQHARMHRR